MILLLDMDEVICNFVKGACKAHFISVEQMEHYRVPGKWDISGPLGLAKTAGMCGFSQDEFWEPIHKQGVSFWENLEKLPWFDEVIEWAYENFDNWFIVTSPSRETCSYTGKVNWLRREFGNDFNRFFLTPHKEMLAKKNRLLVDDSGNNIRKFIGRGGQGLVFPTRGGEFHDCADNPVEFLRGWYTMREN